MTAVNPPSGPPSDDDSPPEGPESGSAEAVVRGYLAAFAAADPDAIASMVSEDFVNEHTAALGTGCGGRAAYRERLPGFLADMVDLRYDIEHCVIEPRGTEPRGTDLDGSVVVAVFYVLTARWQGEHPVRVRGAQRLVVRDGLIAHRVDYWDSAVFLAQVDPEAAQFLASRGAS